MSDKLRIGFIGNGKSTNRYHAPFILTRRDTIEIRKIWARNLNKKEWARIEGVTYTDNLDDVLYDPEIDVIVITLPHNLHYDYIRKALEAGKNCVCEKPFVETSEQAKELFALADEKGLMLQCYQNRRFDSDFLTVQKVIESGKLGDLLELEMHFDYYRPEIPESVKEFHPAFGYLYGHGCHTLDQVISYFGKPDHVHYDVRQLLGEGRMNDYFDLDLYYGILKVSVKSSYFRVKERPSFIVYGKKGMFEKYYKDRQEADLKKFYLPEGHSDFGVDTPDQYGTLRYYDEDGFHEEKVVSVKGDYGYYYDALYETIRNGKPQLVTHEQTLWQLEMLETGVRDLR
ncbi:MAG: Gfo/Idh/MocA family oxidoreductase [Solobacterium sp.]|nr:Gfo/Idh/MocA family oxidoreductase [Solobacterium sp.]